MIPIRIEMENFGPYRSGSSVDFSSLNGQGLFLITGPTGSGKTTLLDAMSCALYGKATGSIRGGLKQFRSSGTENGAATVVRFSFSLGENRYRFERSYNIRDKKRGKEGLIEEEFSSCYTEEAGEWRLLCSGAQVEPKAVELLGFDARQFSQVIVLPQGEFRKLLTASSVDKEKILEVLFGTESWKRLAEQARRKAASLEKELGAIRSERRILLEQHDAESLEALETLLAETKRENEEQRQRALALAGSVQKLSAQVSAEEALEKSFLQLGAAKKRSEELNALSREMEEKAGKLERDGRARAVLPYWQGLEQAKTGVSFSERRKKDAETRLIHAIIRNIQCEDNGKELPSLKMNLSALEREAARLERSLSDAKSLFSARKECQAAADSAEQCEKDVAELVGKLEELDRRIANGEDYIRRQREDFVEQIPALSEEHSRLSGAKEALHQYEKREKELSDASEKAAKAEKRRNDAQVSADAAKKSYDALLFLQQADAAYTLSRTLSDGMPCPVCGATTHPSPAIPAESVPTAEELSAARAHMEACGQALSDAMQYLAGCVSGMGSAKKLRDESLEAWEQFGIGKEALEGALEKAENALETAQKARRMLPQRERLLSDLRTDRVKRAEELRQKQDGSAREKQRLEAAKAVCAQLARSLGDREDSPEAIGSEQKKNEKARKTIDDRIKAIETAEQEAKRELSAASEAVKYAEEALVRAAGQQSAAQNEFENACQANRLDTNTDPRDGILADDLRREWEEEQRRYHQDRHLTEETVRGLTAELAGKTPPNLDESQARLNALNMEKTEADEMAGALRAKERELTGLREKLLLLESDFTRADRAYRCAGELSELLNGKNVRGTPISQFVLGIMMDDILQSANEYFSTLSAGQYTLIRVDRDGGRGFKGLELNVMDAYRGGMRSVNTLSGGEMFLASLSLAFGLADTVQNYAGGIRLDSVFIDEGFGSLDEETLDCAMKALYSLRESGRMIGIISHVRELKGRMEAQIEVIPDAAGGSRLKTTW